MSVNWIGWLIQTATMLGIGVIGYFIKDTNDKIQERIKQNEIKINKTDEKLENLEQKFNDFKAELPTKYVQKDDFIRAMSNVDTKLDKIYDLVAIKKGCE